MWCGMVLLLVFGSLNTQGERQHYSLGLPHSSVVALLILYPINSLL